MACRLAHPVIEASEGGKIYHVALHAGHLPSDKRYGRVLLFLPTVGDKDIRAFRYETLRGRQLNARAATHDERNFALQVFTIQFSIKNYYG